MSAAAIGIVCAYVLDYGTPPQRDGARRIADGLLAMGAGRRGGGGGRKRRRREETGGKEGWRDRRRPQPDWSAIRGELQDLAGPWLWGWAAARFRGAAASAMGIPPPMSHRALPQLSDIKDASASVEKEDEIRGYVSFADYDYPEGDAHFEEPTAEEEEYLRSAAMQRRKKGRRDGTSLPPKSFD